VAIIRGLTLKLEERTLELEERKLKEKKSQFLSTDFESNKHFRNTVAELKFELPDCQKYE
jgi:hypothetical protein